MTGLALGRRSSAVAVVLALAAPAAPARAAGVDEARRALEAGRYEEAIDAYRAAETAGERRPELYRGLAEALSLTGRYEEALETLARFGEAAPGSAVLETLRGTILYELGRIDEAEAAFRRAIEERAPDRRTAELRLAVSLYERGEREEALRRFDRFIDYYNESASMTSEELVAVGTACRYLGVRDPQLYKDALRAYDEAIEAAPDDLRPRILVGELFLEKYNGTDAREAFAEVLERNPRHPRALLGLAKVLRFEGAGAKAREAVEAALEVNPRFVPARVELARLLLELEAYEEATEEARRALEVNPVSLEALSILAAARFLSGDSAGFEEARRRVFARNPRYAELYNTLAEVAVQNRLYREAVDFAAEAVRLDETSWRAYGLLGLNELRIGLIEQGRRHLERSFAGDPYNVWIKNTLDLLDTFVDYREVRTERFSLWIDEDEAELIATYLGPLAEEAYDRLAERYGYRPPTPIRVEVYPSHADFSVRTIGLAGLGALGVCFGPVIAIDSPAAREKGQFNWASTFWHELAHTVTLGMTDHRVPRWLSEGLSVYEEHRAREGWGDDASLSFLMAFKAGELLPVARLNDGFIRPKTPQQIGVSYYQASLVAELIDERYGFDAIRRMLEAYRRGARTDAVFREVLGLELEEFDRAFEAWLEERFGAYRDVLPEPVAEGEPRMRTVDREAIERRVREAPRDFTARLAYGIALYQEGKLDEAAAELETARTLLPLYAGPDGPDWFLAQIYRRRGEPERAEEALRRFVAINETHYDAHVALADLLEDKGDAAGAAAMLERAVLIYPYEAAVHERLAGLYEGLGEKDKRIRERRALVALDPVDRAQALYELARALFDAGRLDEARREVLRALEIAPGFGDGLDLLLEIRARRGGSS